MPHLVPALGWGNVGELSRDRRSGGEVALLLVTFFMADKLRRTNLVQKAGSAKAATGATHTQFSTINQRVYRVFRNFNMPHDS